MSRSSFSKAYEEIVSLEPMEMTFTVEDADLDKLNEVLKDINVKECPWFEIQDKHGNKAKYYREQRWIPCSERLPEEYGVYRITWTTSYAPSKRFIGDSEYEVTSVWDEERGMFKGEWMLDVYIQGYPDVKVIAWKPLEEPYKGDNNG